MILDFIGIIGDFVMFQSESWCEAFHMKISFIHMQILVHLHVSKTNFHTDALGFALGLALKQRQHEMGYLYPH